MYNITIHFDSIMYNSISNMYYKRDIEDNIKKYIDGNKAVILTGMRRIGKTTLFKEIYRQIKSDNKLWFDFENPLDTKYFEDIDYNDIYENIIRKGNLSKKEKVYVFIDEVQHYPSVSRVVKYLIDHYDIKFFLTGSASYYLKNLFPESLAGRKIIFEMYPLNFEEFLRFKKEDIEQYRSVKEKTNIKEIEYEIYDKLYEEFVEWGGFPEVVSETDFALKTDLLEDIFGSYFQKEVLGLADYRKNEKIRDLILLLAVRVGSQLDLVKISQELQITRATVYSYLSFLKATYFIGLVSQFSGSIDREVSGTQKIYFCDNGILKILSKDGAGKILENAVYNQLKTKHSVHYYRSRSGAKIDFIVDRKIAYEVKATASPVDAIKLKRVAHKVKLNENYIVSKNYTDSVENIVYAQFL